MPTLRTHSHKCPGCSAPLKVMGAPSSVTCTYCGEVFELAKTEAMPAVYSGTASRLWMIWLAPLVLVFAIALVSQWITRSAVQSAHNTLIAVEQQANQGNRGEVGTVPPGEHMQWVSFADGPFAARVNDDGIEDVVGHHRVLSLGADMKSNDYIGAFDGASFQRLWQVGPFGKPQQIHFAVSQKRVLVTDDHQTARMFELATGKALATVPLSDAAAEVCVTPSGFFVTTVDHEGLQVDLDGTFHKGPRPRTCPTARVAGDRCGRFSGWRTTARCSSSPPEVRGASLSFALQDGDSVVGIGERSPGTSVPMAVGFDAKTHRVKWSRVVPSGDPVDVKKSTPEVADVRDQTAYVQYELDKGARLVAIDVADGSTKWDVMVPHPNGSVGERIVISDARVYLPHWTWLEVFDRKTGIVLGTVGRW